MNNFDNTNKWAIWIKTAKSWLKYKTWTLNVEWKDYKITMFDNQYKKTESQPDFNIIIEAIEENKTIPDINISKTNKKPEYEEITIDDIPF